MHRRRRLLWAFLRESQLCTYDAPSSFSVQTGRSDTRILTGWVVFRNASKQKRILKDYPRILHLEIATDRNPHCSRSRMLRDILYHAQAVSGF